jgi:LytS/YehU family sensor histidine kinase
MLELYVSVMKARFEDALHLDITVDEGVKDALVPQLILQPIVENAIRHGFDPRASGVHVAVSVVHAGDSLMLSVRDHGAGLDQQSEKRVGLTNTQSRLERLHGAKARFEIAEAVGGGTEVTICLPWQIVEHAT